MTIKIYEKKGAKGRLIKLVPCKINGIPQLRDDKDNLVKPYEATMLLVNAVNEMQEVVHASDDKASVDTVMALSEQQSHLRSCMGVQSSAFSSLIIKEAANALKANTELKGEIKKMKFKLCNL